MAADKIDVMFWKRPDRREQARLRRWIRSLPRRTFVQDGWIYEIGYDPDPAVGYYIERVCSTKQINSTLDEIATGLCRFFRSLMVG